MPTLPAKADPVWLALVRGEKTFEFTLLGAKLFIGHAARQVRANPAAAPDQAAALYGLFEKFKNTPAAQNDLSRLR